MTADRAPTGLRTDDADRPLGVDEPPRLAWRLPEGARRQVAYRVLVAGDPGRLTPAAADWDSGRVESEEPWTRYDGPLAATERYCWRVRVWTEGDGDGGGEVRASAWSDPARWETGPLDAADWDADWIRAPPGEADWQVARARREFSLPAEPTRARAYVAACQRFELAANGSVVGWGQADCYPDEQYYAAVDCTAALRAGANAVGAICEWSGACQGRPEGEPGLLVRLVVECADGSEVVVTTGDGWRVREAEWLPAERRNGELGPVERVDGRDAPDGWATPDFDDGDWTAPDVVGTHPAGPWERLRWQGHGVVRETVDPVSLTRREDGGYVVDFGRVYAGRPVVRFAEGAAGRAVEMRAGYRLAEDGSVSTEWTQGTDMRYEYVQRDGSQRFRPMGYLGVRYLGIDDPGEQLDREQVALQARHAAGTGRRGADAGAAGAKRGAGAGAGAGEGTETPGVADVATFRAANDTLEDVWELCRHSLRYGTQEGFVDTPTREQGQFLGDAVAISAGTTRAFRERRVTRRALREFARSRERYWAGEGRLNAVYPNGDGARDIPDFTLLHPAWAWAYYRQSGDRDLLSRVYPTMDAVADYALAHVEDATGLVTDLTGGSREPYRCGIVDWPPEMRYGYDVDAAALTTVNALAVRALERTADAAAALDRPAAAAERREQAEALAAAVNAELTRDDGVYVDGLHADGERSERASQQANAIPLALDLVPAERVDAVADHVAGDVAMGPMTGRWLVWGLAAGGRYEAAVDCLTDAEGDGWANVLAQGGTFTWESWRARDEAVPLDERRNRSESHAWGAGALAPVQEELLGVSVVEPGGRRVLVAPPPAGLGAAAGRVPTEYGPVAVDWERAHPAAGAGRAGVDLDVTVPPGASATVALPAAVDDAVVVRTGAGETVWDGERVATPGGVRDARREERRVVLDVAAGEHAFEARPR